MNGIHAYLALFRAHRAELAGAAALLFVGAAVPGATALLSERVLDAALVDPTALPALCAAFAVLVAAGGAARLARTSITKRVAWDVASELRRRLHARTLQRAPTASAGQALSALTHEVDELQYGVSALVTALRNPLALLVLAGAATALAPRLAAGTALLLPAVVLPAWWAGRRLRRAARRMRRARAALVELGTDQLRSRGLILRYAAEEQEQALFARADAEDRDARVALEVLRVLPAVAVQIAAAAVLAALLWVGGAQVAEGSLTAGALVGFGVAIGLMSRPLQGLSEVWSLLQRSLAALERVQRELAVEPARRGAEQPVGADLSWRGVHLALGGLPVLCGVDLEVRAGTLLAIVGTTGAGKSTLLSLVAGHRRPDRGSVEVGGRPVPELEPGALRRHVAHVAQDDQLLARTVADNVRLGAPGASAADIEAALRCADAAFALELPDGVQTKVGERGTRLSGGERQRICVARALCTDAPVLLLDEALNQLDADTEQRVLEGVRRWAAGRTVVAVVHDLGAAACADRIALLEGGRIAEEGTHAELVARGGRYAGLWAAARRVA